MKYNVRKKYNLLTDVFTVAHKAGVPIWEILKLKYRRPRKEVHSTILFGKKLLITNDFWHLYNLIEIFKDEVYEFEKKEKPVIVDCGSNVGLSIIYYKKKYPDAQITAFEPDEMLFNLLKKNLKTFDYDDVLAYNQAVWVKDGKIGFSSSGDLGGKISIDDSGASLTVKTFRLKKLLGKKIDFLKLDIEGAEYEVLNDCAEELKNIGSLFIEYHSIPSHEQTLDKILRLLKEAGFRTYIRIAWENMNKPLVEKETNFYYDMQLNIFCYR